MSANFFSKYFFFGTIFATVTPYVFNAISKIPCNFLSTKLNMENHSHLIVFSALGSKTEEQIKQEKSKIRFDL